MFTGIVEELGQVVAIDRLSDAACITVAGPLVTQGAGTGDSIAVNGVCLTATNVMDGRFSADVMAETLVRTNLGSLVPGSPVNLERPLRADGRFGGHVVSGHVDSVGHLISREVAEHWEVLRISFPRQFARFLVEKGSVTVDGVSLTVVDVADDPALESPWFSVSLIPTTLAATTLGRIGVGEAANLEFDILAKYLERLIKARA